MYQSNEGGHPIDINLSTKVRRSTVMLSATKHLGPANEILSEAKDDSEG